MARIPIVTERAIDLRTAGPRRVSAEDIGPVAAVNKSAQRLIDKADRDDAFKVDTQAAKARSDWTARIAELEQSAEPGAPDFTVNFEKEYDDFVSTALENAPSSSAARQRLATRLGNLRVTLSGRASNYETASRATAKRQGMERIVTDYVNATRSDPSQLDEDTVELIDIIDSTLSSGNVTEKYKQATREKMADAAVSAEIDAVEDAAGAQDLYDEIKDGKEWKKKLSASDYNRALARGLSAIGSNKSRERRVVINGLADAVPEMEAGIQTQQAQSWKDQINEIIEDPTERKKLLKRVDRAAKLGNIVNEVANASPKDTQKLREGLNAKISKKGGFRLDVSDRRNFEVAVQRRNAMLKQDAASYTVTKNPDVRKKFNALTNEMQAAAQGEETNVPAAAQEYIMATAAEQEHMMGPLAPISPLPGPYVAQFKTDMANVERTPEGAQRAFNRLVTEANTWGSNWPMVLGQLQRQKAVTGDMAAAARMTSQGKQAAGLTLVKASSIGMKELISQIAAPGIKSRIEVEVSAELADLKMTLDPQVGGDSQYSDMFGATNTLAAYYTSRGDDLFTAARKAATEVINSDYTFVGTYRVPQDIDSGFVNFGAESILNSIDQYDLVIADMPPGITDKDAKSMVVSVLQQGATWITNKDETGLQLMRIEANGDYSAVFVRNDKGDIVPLTATWDDLVSEGTDSVDFELDDDEMDSVF